MKGVFALATTTLQHEADLKDLIRKTQLLLNEPRLDPWLARVLITELIWGKQSIKGDAKPLQTILNYENQLRDILKTINPQQNEEPIFKKKGNNYETFFLLTYLYFSRLCNSYQERP